MLTTYLQGSITHNRTSSYTFTLAFLRERGWRVVLATSNPCIAFFLAPFRTLTCYIYIYTRSRRLKRNTSITRSRRMLGGDLSFYFTFFVVLGMRRLSQEFSIRIFKSELWYIVLPAFIYYFDKTEVWKKNCATYKYVYGFKFHTAIGIFKCFFSHVWFCLLIYVYAHVYIICTCCI